MATVGHVRGMILEEVMLHLLRRSGYIVVDRAGTDPTLKDGHSGLEVKGRGENHQIDGVADFSLRQPFGHPARLLLEAKFRTRKTGIDIVRNAVGVVKDVSEYFAPTPNGPPTKRYHYQMAIASASPFSMDAQRYAFAQDIDLIPLQGSVFFRGMLDAISAIVDEELTDDLLFSNMLLQRQALRNSLRDGSGIDDRRLQRVVEECRNIGSAFMGVTRTGQRLFLVPAPQLDIDALPLTQQVRVYWNDHGWYIRDVDERPLFSFDLPEELLGIYSEGGNLRAERALTLKGQELDRIFLYVVRDDGIKVHQLLLDQGWYGRLLDQPHKR